MVNTGNWGKCVQINGMIASEPASMKKEPQAYPEATPSTGGALPQRRGFMSNSDLDLGRKPGGDHGARLGAGAGGLAWAVLTHWGAFPKLSLLEPSFDTQKPLSHPSTVCLTLSVPPA